MLQSGQVPPLRQARMTWLAKSIIPAVALMANELASDGNLARENRTCNRLEIMSEQTTSSQETTDNDVARNSNPDIEEIEPGPGEPPPPPKSTKGAGIEPVRVTSVSAKSWPPETVGDLMTRKLITLREDEPVGDLETWMERLRFHHLPVIDANNRLVGLITRTDLLHAMVDGAHGVKVDANTPAGIVMRRLVVTAKPDYVLTDALRVMLKEKLSCLPVVLDDATLVGIVTNTDFIKLALYLLEQ